MASKKNIIQTPGYEVILGWFQKKNWTQFPFQEETWQAYLKGKDGLLNAPTGSGKTLALYMPVLIDWINKHPGDYKKLTNNGLRLLWITPLRALTNDIKKAMASVAWDLDIPWLVKIRTGDTSASDKALMKKTVPEVLITTPESLHVMLAQKEYAKLFANLEAVVVDEWHELMGTKRGVQVELGLSRLRAINTTFRTWGISATIGNLPQALDVLLGPDHDKKNTSLIKAHIEKKLEIKTILPDEIEHFPWSGAIGFRLLPKVIPIIMESRSTLIFINTRSTVEMWYKQILEVYPDLAGLMAVHHGSLDRAERDWVEAALHEGKLKVVICTSSLDLGVDFEPVETVIQVGSPKAVARFLQRAGRSGHQPGKVSVMHFLPTNSLELIESAALKEAIKRNIIEDRKPLYKPFDVLVQYLGTLAVSDGFYAKEIYPEVKSTFAFQDLTDEEWNWLLDFITSGGHTLREYEEYQKVDREGDFFKINKRRIALRHRMAIGTIVSEPSMTIQFLRGSRIGSVEESFISRMKPGDVFWFAGRSLQLVQVKEMTAYVRKATSTNGIIPSWQGDRMSLSRNLAELFREKLENFSKGKITDIEVKEMKPLLRIQSAWSKLPGNKGLLIEQVRTREGYHYYFYPFAGRYLHEGMGALIAYRLSQSQPVSFSIAMNDYGFELLTDQKVDIKHAIDNGLFSPEYLHEDMQNSLNSTEMAKRKFREIAQIAGLIFTGYPGHMKKNRHLQASSSLLFDVFKQYDPDNLLVKQAYDEVFRYQLAEDQLRDLLARISNEPIYITRPHRPTPFAFPILVDRLREKLTSEKLVDRITRLQLELEEDAEELSYD